MTPDLPLAYAYGDNRRTTKGLTRDHRPLPTLRTFLSLLPLVALTFPPAPFLSHAAGEEGGDDVPHLPPRRKKGEGSVAVATLRLRLSTIPRPSTSSPLSRSAGAGPGVRAALTSPPYPPSSPTLWARRGERRDGSESILAISQMVAQARYMLDKKSGCLIRL